MNSKISIFFFSLISVLFWQCKTGEDGSSDTETALPYLGNWHVESKIVEEKTIQDTVFMRLLIFHSSISLEIQYQVRM